MTKSTMLMASKGSPRRLAIICPVLYLDVGEWVLANLGFGAVWVVVALGVFALGYWVLRGDRLNRAGEMDELREDTVERASPGEEQG